MAACLAAGKAYLNVHSTAFPGGEIRGFLLTAPQLVTNLQGFLSGLPVTPAGISTSLQAKLPEGASCGQLQALIHEAEAQAGKKLTAAQATLLAKNNQQNTIYQSDPGLPGGQPFISVIDAIPADGMNPLWAEVQIAFTPGHTPRQLFSDDEIAAAFASGEITLTPTNEMYRCSVIGAVAPVTTSSSATSSFGSSRTIARAASSTASAPSATVASSIRIASWGAIKRSRRPPR